MGFKVNEDGSFAPFRGWTIICPVRVPNSPIGAEVDEINRQWSKSLGAALERVKSSEGGNRWALLPHESMHMTVTGLGEEKTGRAPHDLKVRLFPLFCPTFTVPHPNSPFKHLYSHISRTLHGRRSKQPSSNALLLFSRLNAWGCLHLATYLRR